MNKPVALVFVLVSLMTSCIISIRPITAQSFETITIKADGSVDPSTAPITQTGNIYTLTRNILGTITIEKSYIIFDGAGYTVQHGYQMRGLKLSQVNNVIVNNVVVKETESDPIKGGIGIRLESTTNSIIANNTVTKNVYGIVVGESSGNIIAGNNVTSNYSCGIYLSSDINTLNNTIIGNYITANGGQPPTVGTAVGGIFFQSARGNTVVGNQITDNTIGIHFMSINYFPAVDKRPENLIYHNNFIDNTQNIINEAIMSSLMANTWDNGSTGNYWSDYTGNDANLDGIGDTPYVIDANNQDNYSLMAPFDISSIELPELPGAPSVFVVSPENATYTAASVPLNFTVSKRTSWMGYSLDGQENVTVTENITLTGLSNGLHTLTVYANDTFGYTGASETIYFRVSQPEPFPTTWIVAAIVIIAMVGAAFLVYFRKVKKTTGKVE